MFFKASPTNLIVIVSLLVYLSCKEELKPISGEELRGVVVENKVKSPVSELQLLDTNTDYILATINGFQDSHEKVFDLQKFGTVYIRGWAIDKKQNSTADKVYVCIGDKFFEANYGADKPGVVSRYNNEKLLKSGFECRISKSKLGRGKTILFLYILSSDKKSYYMTGKREIIL